MKIQDIITEAPLPEDWDKEIYKIWVPFEKRIEYAKKMATKIGSGSSRVAFTIPYEGRDTVLKIAKNKKGMVQNDFEVKILSDSFVKKLGIVIPMIDFDGTIAEPTWIHVEKAERLSENKFKEFFGDYPHPVINYIKSVINNNNPVVDELYENNKYVKQVIKLAEKHDLLLGDFTNLDNWGLYKGTPVIIDVGLSKSTHATYYAKKTGNTYSDV